MVQWCITICCGPPVLSAAAVLLLLMMMLVLVLLLPLLLHGVLGEYFVCLEGVHISLDMIAVTMQFCGVDRQKIFQPVKTQSTSAAL